MTICELIPKLKAAESKEDIVALAEEVGAKLTEEQVNEVFAKLETLRKDGELTDDELDNVSGGCSTDVNNSGSDYTIVTNDTLCINGHYELYGESDNWTNMRELWWSWTIKDGKQRCGMCEHLGLYVPEWSYFGNIFGLATGYCKKSKR